MNGHFHYMSLYPSRFLTPVPALPNLWKLVNFSPLSFVYVLHEIRTCSTVFASLYCSQCPVGYFPVTTSVLFGLWFPIVMCDSVVSSVVSLCLFVHRYVYHSTLLPLYLSTP